MRVGIGLPAAVPGRDMRLIGAWAERAENADFASVGVIDRLIYDNLDPVTALAAAAACTSRVELISTLINVCWRNNPVLLAKQLSSLTRLSGGRLTAGLGMGGWPADYAASGVPVSAAAACSMQLWRRWSDVWRAADHRPHIVLGGTGPRALTRAATVLSDGWVAPLFGLQLLRDGRVGVQRAWADAGRVGRPRIVSGRYFSLGASADGAADAYIHHYYGAEFFDVARADTLTSPAAVRAELQRLSEAGCDDVVLFPCAGGLEQIGLLAEIVHDATRKERDDDPPQHWRRGDREG